MHDYCNHFTLLTILNLDKDPEAATLAQLSIHGQNICCGMKEPPVPPVTNSNELTQDYHLRERHLPHKYILCQMINVHKPMALNAMVQ